MKIEMIKSEKLNEKAYMALKQAIITKTLAPGIKINETQLTEILGVSRTPIRDAINQLKQEGFIIKEGNKGHFVLKVTEVDIEEIYEIRILIEGYAIRKIINNPDLKKLKIIEDGIIQYQKNTKKTKGNFVKVDEFFHDQIVKLANNKRMYNYFRNLKEQMKVFRSLTAEKEDRVAYAMDLHLKILDAIKNKDLDMALKLFEKHVSSGKAEALSDMRL